MRVLELPRLSISVTRDELIGDIASTQRVTFTSTVRTPHRVCVVFRDSVFRAL